MASMNTTLRIGGLTLTDSVLDIADDGQATGQCSYSGIIGRVFQILNEKLWNHGFKCIMKGFRILGSYHDGRYDGAIGALYDDEIDFVGMPSYFPLNDPLKRFDYSPQLYEDTMTILSAYMISDEKHYGDVISMFQAIPVGIWIGYAISFFVFVSVSYIGSMVLRKNFSSLWMTICAYLDQDNYPTTSIFMATLSSIVMVAMFLLLTYATNCLGTDLVTTVDPITITTYDEIIGKKIKVYLTIFMPEYERFSSSPKGTKERIMFDLRRDIDLNQLDIITELGTTLLDQKGVLIGRPLATRNGALALVGMEGFSKSGRMFMAPDPEAKKYTNVFLYNSRIIGSPMEQLMTLTITRLGEHGFAHYLQERTSVEIVQYFHGENRGGLPSHEAKIVSKIESQPGSVIPIGWSQFQRLMVMFFAAIAIGVIVLFGEIAVDKFNLAAALKRDKADILRRQRLRAILVNNVHVAVASAYTQ